MQSVVVYCTLDILPFKKPCDHEGDTSRFIIVYVVIRGKPDDDMPELLFPCSMPEPLQGPVRTCPLVRWTARTHYTPWGNFGRVADVLISLIKTVQ